MGNKCSLLCPVLSKSRTRKCVDSEWKSHKTHSSSWLPPRENWDPGSMGLPYGWEGAVDKSKKQYFINHVENFTTRDDPRDDPDYIEPPKPREVELIRDVQKGFGFVAGSEKPVVVRFVTEGGPSVDKLLPGDQIIKINGQDVKKAPREFVIDLVRACKQSINLTVCQPYNDNSSRKSALLTAAKKDRLKKNPSRVRFAEEIIVNGASVPSNSPEESYVPFMPNVLKVFLENGQTKSFKYDNKTTVKDVVNSLQEKLNIKCIHHFNLVLHNMKSHMPGRMTLLQDHETVSEIASRPGSRHFRCLFRVAYVPKDSYDLLKQDPIAFEYFYTQCVNDVIQERFASEMKTDTLLRLAALHIQQHAMSNNVNGKINIKTVEKEFGFEKFVPPSIRENMKVKDLRKVLAQCLKMNQNLTAPGQKQLTALQAKLHYMKIVSELKTFGSRVFMVTLLDKKTEAMVLVGPKSGISLVTNVRFYTQARCAETLSMLADFSEVQCIKVAREKENMNRVELSVKGDEPGTLNLGLLKEDAMNFVSMVNGYYRIFVDPNGNLIQKNAGRQSNDPDIPVYESKHVVIASPWSYPEDIVSMTIDEDENEDDTEGETLHLVDLSRGPPGYEANKDFISKLKQDLGIKAEQSTSHIDVTEEQPAEVDQSSKPSKVREPIKTVIKIESPRPMRPDSDSDTSSSISQTSDAELSPLTKQTVDSSKQNSGPNAREATLNGNTKHIDHTMQGRSLSESVEYMNTGKNRKPDTNGNGSDTDSGVGGEGDRNLSIIQDDARSYARSNGHQTERVADDWDTPPDTPIDTQQRSGLDLPRQSELQIDLSTLIDPSYKFAAAPESPSSSTSIDQEGSSFMGPFDPEQLPQEIQDAVYDPRLFSRNEIYIDPDIIDLTLLPPFPPTDEELSSINISPSSNTGHSPLLKTSSIAGNTSTGYNDKTHSKALQKSVSVGYCPDFLDDDIDAIIDKLTVQPPPTSGQSTHSQEPSDSDALGTSWNGPIREQDSDGLGFENPQMSKTIDLGSLAMDDQYSSLVIPPPPEESFAVQEIPIVPPVEFVKEKRKKFQKSDSEGYLKSFGKKDKAGPASVTHDNKSVQGSKSEDNITVNGNANKDKNETNTNINDTSPASVSEKLNALLKSLSIHNQEEEDSLGHFRRTSSLRLGRSSSMDILDKIKNGEPTKNQDLVTGSVRVKPKIRPKLNIERLQHTDHVALPLKSSSLERDVKPVQHEEPESDLKFQRAHSVDVLHPDKSDISPTDDTSVSESFASLKAKLQSYRDSLLNRSLRRKKKMEAEKGDGDRASLDGDSKVERKSSLTRSNSFSSLIRRSLGRSAGKEFKKAAEEGRSSSATRCSDTDDVKADGKDSGSLLAKDRRYWNTLTTSRSNFRPNTGSSQTQQQQQPSRPTNKSPVQ
ncbi:Frmpd3p [Mactra antiquata]